MRAAHDWREDLGRRFPVALSAFRKLTEAAAWYVAAVEAASACTCREKECRHIEQVNRYEDSLGRVAIEFGRVKNASEFMAAGPSEFATEVLP
jgi:hypothetical protein